MIVTDGWSYDFTCALSRAALHERAEGHRGWRWSERDKDAFGTYLACVPQPGLALRIYDLDGPTSDGPTYTVDVRFGADFTGSKADVDAGMRALLSRLGAWEVVRGDSWD
jgi:hypothetical protein